MDYRIFNVSTDAKCRRLHTGLRGHRKRVCTESWLWGKSPSPHRGIESASASLWSFSLPTELQAHRAESGTQSVIIGIPYKNKNKQKKKKKQTTPPPKQNKTENKNTEECPGCQLPSSFRRPECHKSYFARKTREVPAMFSLQAIVQQRSEKLVDSKQMFQNKWWCTFMDYERYQQQSNEANYSHSKTGMNHSNQHALHQSTQYNMEVKSKAC